jgi:RNA polymerase sigma-70 factor, ECF subfamily
MLQAARLPARTDTNGKLALLEHQDRSLWDQGLIAGGFRHLGASAKGDLITTYHIQAEIAALHATAVSDVATDWVKIAARYDQLYELEPTPIVALNRAIARSRWQGPAAGLAALEEIAGHPALRKYHLLHAVRAELLKQLGDFKLAAEAYRMALGCTLTAPERRFLEAQLEAIAAD